MPNVYQAAQEYAQKGYSVIPIQPNSKIPAVKWNAYRERKANALDLQQMFAGVDRNLAIVTGPISKLVVVDIDDPKLFEEYESKWHTDMVARTPKGGYHLYYSYDGGDIGNPIGKLDAEIDVRANGGYVLAAPSVVRYEDGKQGEYSWLNFHDPSPLPSTLRERILQILNRSADVVTKQSDNEDGHILWARVLRNGFTAHKHNVEVKDVARYLFRQGMKPDVIHNTLATLNYQDATPLTDYELNRTIASGISYEQARLSSVAIDKPSVFRVKSLIEMMTEVQGMNEEWLIEEWLPASSIVMIAAQPEQYKTWLALEAAVQVAAGDKVEPFLGEFKGTNKPTPTLVIQQEDYSKKVAERVDMILRSKIKDHTLSISDGVISFNNPYTIPLYFHTDRELSFDNDESMSLLEQRIKELNIKLVVIDPLYSLGNSDDHFAGMARKIGEFKRMRELYGTTFVLVHHMNKAAQVNTDGGRINIFGSNLLNGAMETLWLIDKSKTGDRLIARYGKGYNDKMPVMSLSFPFDDVEGYDEAGEQQVRVYSSSVAIPAKVKEGEEDRVSGTMLEVLRVVQSHPNGITRKEIYALLPNMKKGTVDQNTDRLETKELIVKEKAEGSKANVYKPSEEI